MACAQSASERGFQSTRIKVRAHRTRSYALVQVPIRLPSHASAGTFVHINMHDSRSQAQRPRQWHLTEVVYVSTTAGASFGGMLCFGEFFGDLHPTDEWNWVLTFVLQGWSWKGDVSHTQAVLPAILQDDAALRV